MSKQTRRGFIGIMLLLFGGARLIDRCVRPPMGASPELRNQPASIMPAKITFIKDETRGTEAEMSDLLNVVIRQTYGWPSPPK